LPCNTRRRISVPRKTVPKKTKMWSRLSANLPWGTGDNRICKRERHPRAPDSLRNPKKKGIGKDAEKRSRQKLREKRKVMPEAVRDIVPGSERTKRIETTGDVQKENNIT